MTAMSILDDDAKRRLSRTAGAAGNAAAAF